MRILFITATRIGDAVLSSGLLDWLAAQHPQARFTIACGRPAAPLFEAFPHRERLIVMDKRRFSLHWLSLLAQCVGKRWEMVVDLRGSGTGWFLNTGRTIRWKSDAGRHRVISLAALFDIQPPPAPRLWIAPETERAAATMIPAGEIVLGVGPMANWRGKTWPADRFIAMIERLTASNGPLPRARVALFGAPYERDAALPVLNSVPAERRIDLFGNAELPLVGACLKRCALYVGNDSGLMHMAAAAGTPTLGLFGPGDPKRYGPWGERNAVVLTELSALELMSKADFDHRTTKTMMESLTVDVVVEAATELYRRNGARAA